MPPFEVDKDGKILVPAGERFCRFMRFRNGKDGKPVLCSMRVSFAVLIMIESRFDRAQKPNENASNLRRHISSHKLNGQKVEIASQRRGSTTVDENNELERR